MKYYLALIPAILLLWSCNRSVPYDEPIDRKTTPETAALFANLKKISSQGVVFGHQDDLAYGVGWKEIDGKSDVKDVCGSYPGVYGWDVSKLGRPMNIDSVDFERMKGWIKDVFKRGGINTISWHMDNPATGGSSWDNTPAVYSILPGGEKHEFYKGRLSLFADFLRELKVGETYVPVIFRPFHEHTGSWFWWGKGNCSREEYVALWQFTVNYLHDVEKIHHLLIAYSPDQFDTQEQYLEYYPGDDFVDILAYDDYHAVTDLSSHEQLVWRLKTLVEMAESRNKPAAMTETGVERIPDENWFTDVLLKGITADETGSRIAYVLVWRNANTGHHYAPYPGHPSAENFVKFREDPFTLFEDDLPNMYQMPR